MSAWGKLCSLDVRYFTDYPFIFSQKDGCPPGGFCIHLLSVFLLTIPLYLLSVFQLTIPLYISARRMDVRLGGVVFTCCLCFSSLLTSGKMSFR